MEIRKASKKDNLVAIGKFDTAFISNLRKDKDKTANMYIFDYDGGNIVYKNGVYGDSLFIVVTITKTKIHINALLYTDCEELECIIDFTKEELTTLFAHILTTENIKKGK